ncbi:putative membrane protein, partial [Bacteroides fragilis str. 3397 T10]
MFISQFVISILLQVADVFLFFKVLRQIWWYF